MSITARPLRSKTKAATSTKNPTSQQVARRVHYAEAPDRGHLNREAPENHACREAPDAGEGRTDSHEQEFTHGRSQS